MTITLIRFTLELLEPGGITAPEHTTDDLDLPLARDPRDPGGTPVIPPTSIAGALRRLPGIDPNRLFGHEQPGDQNGQASAVWVLGTTVALPHATTPQTSHRNAMDRHRGAPRTHHLYSSEHLPAGTTIEVQLRWDDPDPTDLRAFLTALRAWRPLLGHGVSIGHGAARVTALGHRTLDLDTPADLRLWLATRGPDLFTTLTTDTVTAPESPTTTETVALLDIHWRVADALHIGTGNPTTDSTGHHTATITRDGTTPVVPGSAWKGVLRARCEYVLRSIGVDACVAADCGTCPTCVLFGHSTPAREHDAPASPGAHRAQIRFHRSHISPAQTATDLIGTRTHVAIDRFTGGAHHGLLYTDEVITHGTLHLRITPLHDTTPSWARGLLLAAIRDIADGLVGIGAGTTRGHGTLQRTTPNGTPLPESVTDSELDEIRHALELLTGGAHD